MTVIKTLDTQHQCLKYFNPLLKIHFILLTVSFTYDKATKKCDAEQMERLHLLSRCGFTQLAASCRENTNIFVRPFFEMSQTRGGLNTKHSVIGCTSMRSQASDTEHSGVQSLHIPPAPQFSCLTMELMSVPRKPGFPRSLRSPALSRAAWRATDSLNGNRKLLAARKLLPTE